MSHGSWARLLCAIWFWVAGAVATNAASRADLVGAWIVTAQWEDASIGAPLELRSTASGIEGNSGPLDIPGFFPLEFRGTRTASGVRLVAQSRGKDVGAIDLVRSGSDLRGTGSLFGSPVRLHGVRPTIVRPAATFDHDPEQFHVLTSNLPKPVLRLASGDTVRTSTADAAGFDTTGRQAAMAGNPATGPFYVEGALPGDTLAVDILKLTPNRETAFMARKLSPLAIAPGHNQEATPGRNDTWIIDRKRGEARIQAPSDRLKNFRVALRPMLGLVAVAPPAGLSQPNGDLGVWGGNLDFPELREGATVYLPVYQPGALLFLGDAHARQGDGEITGQGLETSMAVEFRVRVIKGPSLGRQLWAEDGEYVMVSGIGGSGDDALRQATSGLARWLKLHHQLDDNDVAAVLGTSIEYQVAEVIGGKSHIVAKVRKSVLAHITPPSTAAPRE